MKISTNNRPYYIPQQSDSLKSNTGDRGIQKAGGKFDEIQIRQNQGSMPEDKFITAMREKIMAEVAKPTPAKQLENIKSQISANTYSLNLDEVARRIMLT